MNTYVYIYLNPLKPGNYNYNQYKFDYEPMYVGKGILDRYYSHIKKCKKNTKTHFLAKLKQLLNNNLYPIIIKLHENLDNITACKYEMELIQLIGRLSDNTGPLFNITPGGDGGDTFTNSVNKELTRKKLLGRIPWNKGLTKINDERMQDISKKNKLNYDFGLYKNFTWKNHAHNINTKEKMSLSAKNRKIQSKETIYIIKINNILYYLHNRSGVIQFIKKYANYNKKKKHADYICIDNAFWNGLNKHARILKKISMIKFNENNINFNRLPQLM
jgi:hypothetical protein